MILHRPTFATTPAIARYDAAMALLQSGSKLALPTVQLRHTLPDGSQHVDWMIARDESTDAPLLTYRLPNRLDTLAQGQELRARLIGDHRRAYLDYEGPVSGDRGHVTRLCAGLVVHCVSSEDWLQLHVRWGDNDQYLSVRRENSQEWLVQNVTQAADFGNNE